MELNFMKGKSGQVGEKRKTLRIFQKLNVFNGENLQVDPTYKNIQVSRKKENGKIKKII